MPPLDLLLSPLMASILIGVLAGRLKLFAQEEARVFSKFAFTLAMPIAILNFMRDTQVPGRESVGMILAYFLALTAMTALAFVLARRLGGLTIRQAGAAVFATVCGNAVFLGLPIAAQVEGWVAPFLILMLCEGTCVFAIGSIIMSWPESEDEKPDLWNHTRSSLTRALKNPIVLAALLGLSFAIFDVTFPRWIDAPLDFFGPIAAPLGLFILGLYLAQARTAEAVIPLPLLGALTLIKLGLFPALAGGLCWLFTQDATLSLVIAFFTLLPPAVSSVVMASTYGQWERQTAAYVGIGSIIGLITTVVFLLAVGSA